MTTHPKLEEAREIIASIGCFCTEQESDACSRNLCLCACGKIAESILALAAPQWVPSVRHKKRGSVYRVVTNSAQLQTNVPIKEPTQLTVYESETGEFWVRPTREFNDGRFEILPHPPQTEGE